MRCSWPCRASLSGRRGATSAVRGVKVRVLEAPHRDRPRHVRLRRAGPSSTTSTCVSERGKVTSVLGNSGCGKTTLLRLIGGVHAANKGRVVFDGEVIDVHDREQLYRLRRRLGMLFQFGALFTDLTVFDNVAFPLREMTDLPESDDPRHRADEAQCGGPARRGAAEDQRGVGRHGAAHRAGAGHRARPRTDHVRRALCRAGPDLDGRGRQADPHAQRRHRRHLAGGDQPRRARVHGDQRLGGADGAPAGASWRRARRPN
jgi:hypothetical protein